MKIKLFFVLWITLFTVVGVGSFFYSLFQKRERLDLVDLQIASHSQMLADSDFVSMDNFVPIEADEKLQDVLGGYRVGLFLTIRNSDGKILYRNHNADAIEVQPEMTPDLQTLDSGQHILRLKTFIVGPNKDLTEKRYVQIGQILNKNFLRNIPLSPFYYIIVPIWFFLSMILAYLLSSYLFRPIKKLSYELDYISAHLEVDFLEKAISRMADRPHYFAQLSKDEFYELRASFHHLLNQFVRSLQHNISMEGYLVHEINTPLTVAQNKISELEKSHLIDMTEIKNILSNLAKFSQDFLSWASLQYTPIENTQVFAIDVGQFVRKVVEDLRPLSGDRIRVNIISQIRAFASKSDLEHLLQNLIVNALKYSPAHENVFIEVDGDQLIIKDLGPGLSEDVIKNLGKPFNYGPHTPNLGKSTGMGLAIVCAVVNKYDWRINFTSSNPHGLIVKVDFAIED